jgi:hypothetical protein
MGTVELRKGLEGRFAISPLHAAASNFAAMRSTGARRTRWAFDAAMVVICKFNACTPIDDYKMVGVYRLRDPMRSTQTRDSITH